MAVCYITSSQEAANCFKGTMAMIRGPSKVATDLVSLSLAHSPLWFLLLLEYIVNLLAQATTSHDEDMFSSCLIFARQAALEGAHIHPPYHKWFQVLQHLPSILVSAVCIKMSFFPLGPVWSFATFFKESTPFYYS